MEWPQGTCADLILSRNKGALLPSTHQQGQSVPGLEVDTEDELFGEKGKMRSNQGSRQQMGWAHGEQEISLVQKRRLPGTLCTQ